MSFQEWLLAELRERGWSLSELARRADVGVSSLSMIVNELRGPGPDVLLGIARALRLPPETVFRRAGLLPDEPDELPMSRQRADYLFSHLTDDEQTAVLALMESLAGERIKVVDRGHLAAATGQ